MLSRAQAVGMLATRRDRDRGPDRGRSVLPGSPSDGQKNWAASVL
jgi:hypothetical protein